MEASYNKAEKILLDNMDKLHKVAERLMIEETMEADEFEAIMTGQAIGEKDQAEADSEASPENPAEKTEGEN
jgi:cell division protease FtsH